MEKNPFLLVSAILFVMGLIFGGVAGYLYWQEYQLEKNGQTTDGTVIGLVESTDDEGGSTYAPIVRFRTSGGRVYEFQSSFYSSPPEYEAGQSVVVLYDPESPDKAQIKGEGFWLILIFGIIGGSELLASFFFLTKAFPMQQVVE